ncbi:CpxP family protein [Vibrio sp. JPW-9-11-11]|uniref:CpxP family protein n=1 Tax=Vibrio sp. JPW-9-11-11 TaxID=1416532 RepID=UPI0015944B57|nr:CpxP family protein [Vibrio sp. JPW-9-11-11]NVD05462.1 CpxP family protein [Vibrio sp. JPW-9-11-11]
MKLAKKVVLAAAVLPLALGTASAYAFGGKDHKRGGPGECGGGFERGMMRQLDLTDAQQQQLKQMRSEGKQAMQAEFKQSFQTRQAQREAHQAQIQQLMLADNFDQAAANELAKEMVEQQTEHKVKMLEKQHQMMSVLTPEQKAKFTELQQERMGKCAEKMQQRFNNNDA